MVLYNRDRSKDKTFRFVVPLRYLIGLISFVVCTWLALPHRKSSWTGLIQHDVVVEQVARHTQGHDAKWRAELRVASLIPAQSLTAVLPVAPKSISALRANLVPLLRPPSVHLKEIIIVCSQSSTTEIRAILRAIVAADLSLELPEVSLRPDLGVLASALDVNKAILRAAADAPTDWILLLDETGLLGVNTCTQYLLLHPLSLSVPAGPLGVPAPPAQDVTDHSMSAAYLQPPFVMPRVLAVSASTIRERETWAEFGRHISSERSYGIGGIILVGDENERCNQCPSAPLPQLSFAEQDVCKCQTQWLDFPDNSYALGFSGSEIVKPGTNGVFTILLPSHKELALLSSLLCGLLARHHRIQILLYAEMHSLELKPHGRQWIERMVALDHCMVTFDIVCRISEPIHENLAVRLAILESWLGAHRDPNVLIMVAGDLPTQLVLSSVSAPVTVRIPKEDLLHTGWMASLSIVEWKNWNVPRVDISIITKDRPQSLVRLLTSLKQGRFFGDSVDLRINLEQDCDEETVDIAKTLVWPHGSVFVHHRIVHGGLLVAVVESWFPRSNDTYGLLLEDDVELSPLFYAWIKMTLLRYRHGDPSNRSDKLFGISLYQQKNMELPLGGRQAFNARSIFAAHGLSHAESPYLSPIPCSWGAVYFPEHWREFHDYLILRFSETALPVDTIVIPNVRSNNWTKSWKKYFIELVYLQGYVMIYPNYPDFVSLSTNHLEIGSHVKVRTKEKQDLFHLPLMPLSNSLVLPGSDLLQLPGGRLPPWNDLPVLNLTGVMTNLMALSLLGLERRKALFTCVAGAFRDAC